MTELDDAIADYADGVGDFRVRLLRVANAIIAEARKPATIPTFESWCGVRLTPCSHLRQERAEDAIKRFDLAIDDARRATGRDPSEIAVNPITLAMVRLRLKMPEREIVQQLATAPPSDAAKAWRERMDEAWEAYMRFAFEAPESDSLSPEGTKVDALFDEAVALITAAEQRAGMRNAVIHDLQKAVNERIEDCRRIARERDTAQDALEMLQDTTAGMQKIIDIVVKERDAALKRAEAAEAMREVYCNDRDDLRAEVARLKDAEDDKRPDRDWSVAAMKEAWDSICDALNIPMPANPYEHVAEVKELAAHRRTAEDELFRLRARHDKLLAACDELNRTTGSSRSNAQWLAFGQAIAEARSGATDAPQAKEGT